MNRVLTKENKFITSHGRILITPKRDDAMFVNSGILKVKAFVTRTGVFDYYDQQGNLIRELRDAKEVFKPEYLESMHGSPVTIDHPVNMVDMTTLKRDAVGFAGDSPFIEGDLVGIYLFIHDEATQEKIFNGELVEISSGYFAEVKPSSNQAIADTEQFNMINNHFALLPKYHGRAGERVSIRFDSGLRCDSIQSTIIDHDVNIIKEDPKLDNKGTIKQMELDLKDLDESMVKAVNDAVEKARKDFELEIKQDASEKIAVLTEKLDALEKQYNEYVAKEDSRVDSRVELINKASYFLPGNYEFKGKQDSQIMIDVLNTFEDENSEFKADGLTVDYISGQFHAKVDGYYKWLDSRGSDLDETLSQVYDSKEVSEDDLTPEQKLDKAYAARKQRNQDRFNNSSGYTRK